MQSQELAQLSDSLLNLLSVRNNVKDVSQGPHSAFANSQLAQRPYQQQTQAPIFGQQRQQPGNAPQAYGNQALSNHQGAFDPWGQSFTSTQPVRAQYDVSQGPNNLQSNTTPHRDVLGTSPGGNCWGQPASNQGHNGHHSQHGFSSSSANKLTSGLWGGSLWSNGNDNIWSAPDETVQPNPHAVRLAPSSHATQEQVHPAMLSQQSHPQQNTTHHFDHHRPSHVENGLAAVPNALVSNGLEAPHNMQAASAALLAALQGRGQPHSHPQPVMHLQQQHIPPQHLPQQHVHQQQGYQHQGPQHQRPPQSLQELLQQHKQLQQHQQLQQQQQAQHLHQQQQQLHQQQHFVAPGQPSQQQHVQEPAIHGAGSHYSHTRMPPPGFPTVMHQNISKALQQDLQQSLQLHGTKDQSPQQQPPVQQPQSLPAANGFHQSSQGSVNGVRQGGPQPPPPPPRAASQPMPSISKAPVQGSLRNVKPQSTPSPVPNKGMPKGILYKCTHPKSDMGVLSQSLQDIVDQLKPSPEEQTRQAGALQQVRNVLLERWPTAEVHLFGSTANCLSICNNNDIDVCLEFSEAIHDQAGKGEVVEEMGQLLERAGMRDVLPLPKARVPVVKFVVNDTNTKVDITVNNILAIVNTKLLRCYAAIDERLMQLVFIIKLWAKRRQVNDSYRGTLSSYCYVLMCIHLLQQRSPPILPCLQSMEHTHTRTVGQWECNYFDKVDELKGFGSNNKESIAELVWAFFEYWAWRHDYNNGVISVRTGGFLTKSQKEWTRRVGNERHLVCIEDPFELSHDLGRTVDRQTSGVLHKEFERAACVLADLAQPLDKLMEPYRAGKTD